MDRNVGGPREIRVVPLCPRGPEAGGGEMRVAPLCASGPEAGEREMRVAPWRACSREDMWIAS